MTNIEPTYLRYVFDRLQKGIINSDNASTLPNGFIELYDQIFSSEKSVKEREILLQFFVSCAILEVSFSEDSLIEYTQIDNRFISEFLEHYSKLFNRDEENNLKLNHERLKTFILSKSSNKEIIKAHKKLVDVLLKDKLNNEIQVHKHEYLGKYLFILCYFNEMSFKELKRIIFSDDFIDEQFNLNISGDWFYRNLSKAFNYADLIQDKDYSYLYQKWLQSSERTQHQKLLAFKEFIKSGSCIRLINLFDVYTDINILYEELIYAINSVLKKEHNKSIVELSKAILKFFPNDLSYFSWNRITAFNEEMLIDICFRLHNLNFDSSFISNYGSFNIDELLEKFDNEKHGIKLLNFYNELLKNSTSESRSKFYYQVYKKLNFNERNEFIQLYASQIDNPFYKAKYIIEKDNYRFDIIYEELFINQFSRITTIQRTKILYKLFSNQEFSVRVQRKSEIESFYKKVLNELRNEKIDNSLTEEEAFLEKDHQTRRLMLGETTFSKLLVPMDLSRSKEIVISVIEKSNEIKNGGVKGQAVIEVQKMLSGFNKDLEEIANKAYIPRVPLGGLSYGQYKASNLLDLSENSWNSDQKSKAYKFLLKAEILIPQLEELINRDQVSLRLLSLFLNHNRHIKARNILKNIELSHIRILALKSICEYYLNTKPTSIKLLFKHCNSDSEVKFILKYIFNYIKSIDVKKYDEYLSKYLKQSDNRRQNFQETKKTKPILDKIEAIKLNEKKTYPPFFEILHKKEGDKNNFHNKLNLFQKHYFSKDEKIKNEIINMKGDNSNQSRIKLNDYLTIIRDDNFDAFKSLKFSIAGRFHLIQLLHHIIEYTDKMHLYIDYIEKNVDSNLFFSVWESIIFNLKSEGKTSKIDKLKNYKYLKVLRSNRLAKLVCEHK